MPINYWNHLDHNCSYHIYNRAAGDDLLFRDKSDYKFFLKIYKDCFGPYCTTYAFCLMPNHFHFIIKVKGSADVFSSIQSETTVASQNYLKGEIDMNAFLGDQMRRFFSAIPKRYNAKYDRRGPLFQEKVKRVWISNDDRLRYLIAYVHHNPIHHYKERGFKDWRYSSFSGYLSDKATLLPRTEVIELFGGEEAFMEFHWKFKLMKHEEEIDG